MEERRSARRMVTIDEVVAAIKMRMNNPVNLDGVILSYALEIEWRIKNYCQINVVPDGLKYIWIAMVVDILKTEQSTNDEVSEVIDTSGDNIKIGDTSITGGSSNAAANKAMNKPVIDDVVVNYRVDLNRYRKMRW